MILLVRYQFANTILYSKPVVSSSYIVVSFWSISELAEFHMADAEFERCSERFSKTTLGFYPTHPKMWCTRKQLRQHGYWPHSNYSERTIS
jgi:hypothetical protein